MLRLVPLALAFALSAGPISNASAPVRLESDSDIATAGYFRLHWQASEEPTRLVESLDPDFGTKNVLYEGPDTARLISGKSDGRYYYRLERTNPDDSAGDQSSVASNTLQVTVRHHSLARAFTFFAIGAAVFLATLALVLVGDRREFRQ